MPLPLRDAFAEQGKNLSPGRGSTLSCLDGKMMFSKSNTCMKITSKGQVTIPQELRERFGLLPHTEVEFVPAADGQELRLRKSARPARRGPALVARLRGRGTGKRSTDELLKLTRSDR
jgi:antitoxin PrlF